MKKTKLHFMVFLSICILISAGDVFAAKTLYDDFSTGHLDGQKWWPREYDREILDGQLVLKLGNSSGMGAEIRQGLFDNQIPFTDPGSINSIECDITIEETVFDSPDSYSVARVAGYFYNKNASGDATGDIFFHIKVGDMGNIDGLEANWVAYEVQNDDGSSLKSIGEGSLVAAGGINYHTPVNVKVSYDGDRTFSFSVAGHSDSFEGPVKERPSQIASKTLNATILTQNSADKGFIFAKFDNVTVNNQPYDDFSSPRIDTSNWSWTEWVREASNGFLRSNIPGTDSTKTVSTYFVEKDAPFVEAKARINSESQLSTDASGIARIQGYYYNSQRGPGSGQDYNQYEGDVFAQIRLQYYSDNTLKARAFVDRCNISDETDYTSLFREDFNIPISLDTYYTLSIRFIGSQFIFKCNDQTLSYTITTPIYPPFGEHRGLRTRVNLDPGQSGYMKVQFDDVYIEKKVKFNPSIPMLLLSGE
jgi:hypothetical protein